MTTISIITPCFNAAETIADCLNSVASQSIEVEHLVIDGGSTDATVAIAKEIVGAEHTFSEPDKGMYDAINKGIARSTSDVVGVLNADDFYASNDVLEYVCEEFSARVDSIYGDLDYVDRHNKNKVVRQWRSGEYDRLEFKRGWMPPHPTFFLRRSLYKKYGGYRLDMGSAADYELMLRMLYKHKLSVGYIDKVIVLMRTGGQSNVTLGNRIKANRMDKKAWEVNNLTPNLLTFWMKPLRKVSQWLR